MRHYKKGRKLGTDASHTKAMKKNLAVALFTNDRIKTTVTRAKEVRPLVEGVITWAKKGDLHSRRLAIAKLGDKDLVAEIFDKAAQGMWADRNGGYTRIMKLGPRTGENARMVIIEIVSEPCTPKAKKAAAAPVKPVAPKKVEETEEEAPTEEAVAEETVETAEVEAPEAEAAEAAEEAPAEEKDAESARAIVHLERPGPAVGPFFVRETLTPGLRVPLARVGRQHQVSESHVRVGL